MTYYGKPGDRKHLGIKPDLDDHRSVRAMSIMGIGVRKICIALGERFKLGKPMSRQSLYWHFRNDLLPNKRGRKMGNGVALKQRFEYKMVEEMQKLIAQTGVRGAYPNVERNNVKRRGGIVDGEEKD